MIGPALKNWKKLLQMFFSKQTRSHAYKMDSRIYKMKVYKGNVSLEKRPSDNSSKDRVISHSVVGISRGLWSGFCSYKGLGQAGPAYKRLAQVQGLCLQNDAPRPKCCLYKMTGLAPGGFVKPNKGGALGPRTLFL